MHIKYEYSRIHLHFVFKKKKKKKARDSSPLGERKETGNNDFFFSGESRNLDTSRDVNERRRFFTTKFHTFNLFLCRERFCV
jgi:hypothetical protein